jgi:hypothetical protein
MCSIPVETHAATTPDDSPDKENAMFEIVRVTGREILDSRGNPTVEADIRPR